MSDQNATLSSTDAGTPTDVEVAAEVVVELSQSPAAVPWGTGSYVYKDRGEDYEVDHWDKLPASYDNLLKFVPVVSSEPHTEEQHKAINTLPAMLKDFMTRERVRY